jgi:hypothetical protein
MVLILKDGATSSEWNLIVDIGKKKWRKEISSWDRAEGCREPWARPFFQAKRLNPLPIYIR